MDVNFEKKIPSLQAKNCSGITQLLFLIEGIYIDIDDVPLFAMVYRELTIEIGIAERLGSHEHRLSLVLSHQWVNHIFKSKWSIENTFRLIVAIKIYFVLSLILYRWVPARHRLSVNSKFKSLENWKCGKTTMRRE